MRMRTKIIVLATGLLLLFGIIGVLRFRQRCLPHFYAVRTGCLYRGGQPRGLGMEYLAFQKIRTLFSLRGLHADCAKDEAVFATRHNMRFEADSLGGTPESVDAAVQRFLAVMDDKANWPVLVHCSRGLERSGVLTAVFRIEYDNWDNDQALQEMYRMGLHEGTFPLVEEYIRSYRPRREGAVVLMERLRGIPAGTWKD